MVRLRGGRGAGYRAEVGGIQEPLWVPPRSGGTFEIGQVLDADAIPLKPARPLVLSSKLFHKEQYEDTLGLGDLVDGLLRDRSSRRTNEGQPPVVVYVAGEGLSSAYRLRGGYAVADDRGGRAGCSRLPGSGGRRWSSATLLWRVPETRERH